MRVKNITITVSVRVSATVRVSLVLLFCITVSLGLVLRLGSVEFYLLAVTLFVRRMSPSADVVYIRY